VIDLPNQAGWPNAIGMFTTSIHSFKLTLNAGETKLSDRHAVECAADLAQTIIGKWVPYDGVPSHYIFDYEKDIITQFTNKGGKPEERLLKMGCPEQWPKVLRLCGTLYKSPLKPSNIGSWRKPDDTVLVDIRSKYHRQSSKTDDIDNYSCCLNGKGVTFLEAGPREMLLHGTQPVLHVGIVVTGGIAPGINAVIAGLVDRHILYWKNRDKGTIRSLVIHGYRDGFSGLLNRREHKVEFFREGADQPQHNSQLAYIMQNANSGGSMFGTSRYNPLSNRHDLEKRNDALHNVLEHLWLDQIDILYVIGGDGSMKAAHALHVLNEEYNSMRPNDKHRLSIVGIPKTMDNDLLWVWQSFGFMSAVEKATECLRLLHTESVSNPRLCVIQLFGSDSGYTVSHAALASLNCDAALIPEVPFDMERLFQHIRARISARLVQEQDSPFGMIVMAETAVPEDWHIYVRWHEHVHSFGKDQTGQKFLNGIKNTELRAKIRQRLAVSETDNFAVDLSREEVEAIISFVENGRRVYGETPDPLRTASLRVVSQVLQHRIQHEMVEENSYWKTFRVFTNEPRHLLRSAPPSVNDIISGRRFGILAVDNAMGGYSDFMISQWLTEYVLVPLSLVVLGRKRVHKTGIFWKSVLAKTEQKDMT